MFSYNDEDGLIRLTRGDTAYLDVYATNEEGNVIGFNDNVEVLFTVRENLISPILFQISAMDGAIKICPDHTSGLAFGTYRYDVQVTLVNGDVSTYGPYKFKILQEVTY